MKTHFSSYASYTKNFFCSTLSLHWWYSLPRLVWFGQLLNPMKKTYFWNSFFAKFKKFFIKNPTFLLGKLNQKYFLLYTFITLVILNAEFGLILETHWHDENELFLKFSKNRNSRNSQNSVWNPNFFLGKPYQNNFLLYTLITLVILHSAFGLIWTTP